MYKVLSAAPLGTVTVNVSPPMIIPRNIPATTVTAFAPELTAPSVYRLGNREKSRRQHEAIRPFPRNRSHFILAPAKRQVASGDNVEFNFIDGRKLRAHIGKLYVAIAPEILEFGCYGVIDVEDEGECERVVGEGLIDQFRAEGCRPASSLAPTVPDQSFIPSRYFLDASPMTEMSSFSRGSVTDHDMTSATGSTLEAVGGTAASNPPTSVVSL